MNRFASLKGQKVIMPFLMLGDPNFEDSLALAEMLVDTGVEALELGIPFSDPMADGKIIQASAARALEAGMTFAKALLGIERLRAKTDIPIAALTYTNLIFNQGFDQALGALHRAGLDALLLADLPFEEAIALQEVYLRHKIGQVFLIAPNTDLARAKMIHARSSGFSYIVNAMGITGIRKGISDETLHLLENLQGSGSAPLIVGFGIHEKMQANVLWQKGADGVIIGSHLIHLITEAGTVHNAKIALSKFIKEIR